MEVLFFFSMKWEARSSAENGCGEEELEGLGERRCK